MKHKSRVQSGRKSRWLFRLCLLAHPSDVRRRFGDEMERLFTDDVAAARLRGRRARLAALFSALHDIVSTGLRERLRNPEVALTTTTPYRSEGLAMDHLRQDVRFAIRSLARIPGFSMVAVLTLALGIGATTAIFSVVNGVLLRSLPYADAERLVRIWQTGRDEPSGPVEGSNSPVNFQDWRAEASSFEAMSLYARSRPTLTGLGEPEVLQGSRVSPDFFRVFGAQPVLGRSFTDEENLPQGPRTVVISHGFWQQRMAGRADALGGTLELSGTPHEIIGVAPAGFDFPEGARVWMAVRNDDEGCGRGCVYVNTVGKLRENRSLEQARQELGIIADRLSEAFPGELKNGTVAIASLQDTMVGDVRRALIVLLGAVGFVLLIACANVANLLIARGASRTDEMAVRVALGAGRRRVLAQLITESMILALAGGAAGVALAAVGVRALRVMAPGQIPRLDEVGLDANAVLFALGLSLLTVLLFGFAPALQLARSSVAGALRQDANPHRRRTERHRPCVAAGCRGGTLAGAAHWCRSAAAHVRLDAARGPRLQSRRDLALHASTTRSSLPNA